MKRNWIILSIVIVATIAYLDVRDRFAELDHVAATTNVQVEMKDAVPRSTGAGIQPKIETIEKQPLLDDKRAPQKINENTMKIKPDLNNPMSTPSGLVSPISPKPPLN